jgi:hypothetical protein
LARTFCLGTHFAAAGCGFPVHLSIQSEHDSLSAVIARINLTRERPTALLLPSLGLIDPALETVAHVSGITLVDLSETSPDYHYGTYFVTNDWLAENGDTLRGFLTAITQAHRFMYENKDEVVPVIAEATGFDESVIDEAYDLLLGELGVHPVNEGLDPDRVQVTIEQMEEFEILTAAAPEVDSLLERGPITEVVEELGPWDGDPRWR